MRRALLSAACALLVACASAPEDRLTWRESWSLIAADESGLFVGARLRRGNTGLLRGQGQLDVTVFPPSESAVVLRRTAPPQAVRVDEASGTQALMHNGLVRSSDGWTLHVREGRDALDATIQLVPEAPELAPTTLVEGQRQWAVGAPVPHGAITGAWRAGKQGGLLRGYGVLVRERADTWPGDDPGRASTYLITPLRSVGVEWVGERAVAWLASPDGLRTSETVSLERSGRMLTIDLAPELPVSAKIRVGVRSVVQHPWDHLLPFERWIARLAAGWPMRTWERGRAQLTVDGETTTTAALMVHGGQPTPKKRRRDKAGAAE